MKKWINDHFNALVISYNLILMIGFTAITRNFATHVMFILLSIMFWIILSFLPKRYWVIYALGLGVSLISLLLVYNANLNTFGNSYYGGGSDDRTYERLAIISYQLNLFTPSQIIGTVLSEYDVGALYYSFIALLVLFSQQFDGFSTWLPRLVNVFLLLGSSMLLLNLFDRVNKKISFLAIITFLIFPLTQYVNSHVFRDTLNLFLVVFLVWLIIQLKFQLKPFKLLLIRNSTLIFLIIVTVYMIYFLRRNTLVYAIAILGLMFLDWIKPWIVYVIAYLKLKNIRIIMVLAFLSLGGVIGTIVLSRVVNLEYYIETYTQYRTELGMNGLSRFVFQMPILPFGLPVRFLYGLITPFPFINRIMIGFSSLNVDTWMNLMSIGVGIVFFGTPYLFTRLMRKDWISNSFLVIYVSIILTTFTLRHMIFFTPFMLFLIWDQFLMTSVKKRKQLFLLSSILFVVLMIFYLLLRMLLT